ncbi:MAG: hypothetical protein L6R40_008375 [Gallowayella cf. fulva]|nr:MAG: hypothetical protein L6R40_008375 [Xanthomendoza cf. fulva]
MGDLLGTITLTELQSSVLSKDTALTITDCRYVASYNWLNGQKATILVPGAPPAWSPPKDRPNLEEDKDTYLRDPNAARYPHFPTEPAIRAVFALHPDFDTAAIDVVGCGNTMGNLIRFANSNEKTFRLYIEVVGNTVFLVRKENSPTEPIEGVRGYGHTFPEAYTSWEVDVKNSVSHQRLIQYVFGGLRCLVRCESDGYLKDHVHFGSQQLPTSYNSSGLSGDDRLPSLLHAAESIAVGEKVPNETVDLIVRSAGHEVPQTAIFDLKTRSARREIDMEEVYPRLWGEDCWNALPPDLKAKWAGRPNSENYESNESVLTREETTEVMSGGDEDDGLDDYLRF